MEFQTNLKKLRTEEGLTQDQLALLVETSTDTIGRIERKQKIASYEVLFRIARYFDSNRQIMMRSDIKLPQPFASWSNSL